MRRPVAVQGVGILDSALPPMPDNVRAVLHPNECYDWGTFGWVGNTPRRACSRGRLADQRMPARDAGLPCGAGKGASRLPGRALNRSAVTGLKSPPSCCCLPTLRLTLPPPAAAPLPPPLPVRRPLRSGWLTPAAMLTSSSSTALCEGPSCRLTSRCAAGCRALRPLLALTCLARVGPSVLSSARACAHPLMAAQHPLVRGADAAPERPSEAGGGHHQVTVGVAWNAGWLGAWF